MKEVRKELTIKSHNLHSAIMSFEDFSLSGRNIGHTNKSAIQAPPVHNLNKNCINSNLEREYSGKFFLGLTLA